MAPTDCLAGAGATWTTGGAMAAAATVAGMGVIGLVARSSQDPSRSNALARVAIKASWPLMLVAGCWRLNTSANISSVFSQGGLPWGLVKLSTALTVGYAATGLVSALLYDVVCVPPADADPHADEDRSFRRRADEVRSAAVGPGICALPWTLSLALVRMAFVRWVAAHLGSD